LGWLSSAASGFALAIADRTVWLSIGEALFFAAASLLFGTLVARLVGLLKPGAPTAETVGVGLASGLLMLAAWWAAIASSGRSSFTPVAVVFAIAIVVAVIGRARARRNPDAIVASFSAGHGMSSTRESRHTSLILAVLGGGVFVVAVSLLYGSTLVLSPRDGAQPVEFADEAFYANLGASLARDGTESIYATSGFSNIDGLPAQTWYHWGEMWLEAAVITAFGAAPLDARHFVVLPAMLLAAAALTGTLVRRLTGTVSRGAFLFGFLACLFLAPIPLIPGPYFSSRAVGLIFGITTYGLAAVTVLLAIYGVAVLGSRRASWALAIFVGSVAASILPAHIAIALLSVVGVGSVSAVRIVQSLASTRHLPVVTPVWRQTIVATGIALAATVAWGLLTGHGMMSAGASPSVSPFNASWRDSIAIITLGSGAIAAIAIAWFLVRKERSIQEGLYLGTIVLLVTGALFWGWQLADFNTFHVFFAGLVIFGTPVAAVAVWSIWLRLRDTGHVRFAVALLVLCGLQIEFGVSLGVVRLVSFGPGKYPPVPVAILAEIRKLPPGAKLAYACQPLEEDAFFDPSEGGLAAHTGRDVVPMCFQAETFSRLIGGTLSPDVPSPFFRWAPQRQLYPTSGTVPDSADVATFLKDNGIDYVYADALHPNTLAPEATPVAESGGSQVLRIP